MKNGGFFFIFLFLLVDITKQISPQIETHINRPRESNRSKVFSIFEPQFETSMEDDDVAPSDNHHISKRSSGFDNFVKGFEKGSSFLSTVGKLNGSESIGTTLFGTLGGFLCIFFCSEDTSTKEASNSNKPPTFTSCKGPGSKEYFADIGKTTAAVTWTTPTATDPEDGTLAVNLVQGEIPGTQFDRGSHTIIYTSKDKTGASTYCHFSFKISVLTCGPIQWPAHGYIHCDQSEFIYGTKCTVSCFDGYDMDPQPEFVPYQITCDKSKDNTAKLNKKVPRCEAITCPGNATELDSENGTPVCTHGNHKYDSACFTHCHRGYSVSSGILFSTCQKNKTWSTHLPDCEDTAPPAIINCPNTIYAFTEKMSKTANVTWTKPIATDNSGSATVDQIKGQPSGSNFPKGLTEIRYIATDAKGNKSPDCIFFISVEEIRCDPPLILDKYLFYQCSDGYSYGSACNLKCMGSFPLIGNDTITCERNDSFTPPRGYWSMENSQVEPYCSKNPCDTLPAPDNGAMVCDTWQFGLQCQMQCSRQYDIPFGTVGSNGAPFTGLFTCSEVKGTYGPSNTVPGCIQIQRPGMTTVLGEFFYYTGDCGDPNVLDEIRNNFIEKMQRLETQGWNGVCPSQIECNVNKTDITCGSISTKKKRDVNFRAHQFLGKRSTHEIRVEMTMTTLWYDFNSTGGATFYFLEEIQKNVLDVIKSSAIAGALTVGGLMPDTDSFSLGYSNPQCPEGRVIRWSTLTCVPCSEGTYLDTTNPVNPNCKDCPVGTYKESPEDIACSPCPPETSTEQTGSTNITSCLKKCYPGEFSKTGLEPCHLCPKSFYQRNYMSTACISCSFGKTTSYPGATNNLNCSNFDIEFKVEKQEIIFNPPSTDQNSFYISSWISVPKTTANLSLLRMDSESMSIDISYEDSLYIRIKSESLSTGVILPRETWTHIAIRLDTGSQTVVVFVDGANVYSSSISGSVPSASPLITPASSMSVILNGESFSGYIISGYQIGFSNLTDENVARLSIACHSFVENAFISMETIANLSQDQPTIRFITPSICDSSNQCDPDPCNGHHCVDKINGYQCQCKDGYYGDLCQNQPDYCKDSPCKNNGTCSNSAGSFACLCSNGYKGEQCEIEIVNGGWSLWTSFTECSASCAGGVKYRYRKCNSPSPDDDGIPCDPIEANESVICNEVMCPSCMSFKKGFGNKANCSILSDGHKICTVSCRSGYAFSPYNQPLPVYICGPNTSYTWNGNPPPCGQENMPRRLSLVSSIQYYPQIPCTVFPSASFQLKEKLETSLPCSVNGSCSINITTSGCSNAGRRRRSPSLQSIILTQTFVTDENLNLGTFDYSENVSQPLYELLMGISSLEASAIQINNTRSILEFIINGTRYTSTTVAIEPVVECLRGQGRSEALCIVCPVGTFSQSGYCMPCLIGSYQDETGQSSCQPCPGGLTTKYEGSQNITDCSEEENEHNINSTSPSIVMETTYHLSSSITLPTSHLPMSSPGGDGPSKKGNDGQETIVAGSVVCAASLAVIVTVISFYVYKKYKRAELKRKANTMRGSWASLSMVRPHVIKNTSSYPTYYHMPPTSNSSFLSVEDL